MAASADHSSVTEARHRGGGPQWHLEPLPGGLASMFSSSLHHPARGVGQEIIYPITSRGNRGFPIILETACVC